MQTKSINFLLLCLVLSFYGVSAIGQTSTTAKEEWKTLEDSVYTISYPQDWDLDQSGQMGTQFILFSQASSPEDQFKENVNFITQDLTGYNLTLDQYVEGTESQIKAMLTEGKLLSSERITKDNAAYHKLIYTGKQGIYSLKFEQYFWLKDEKAYVLTLTCEENQFDAFQLIGEKVLNSFEIKK